MRRLRISAISYLNTAPLMWDFERGRTGEPFDIAYTLPSRCAQQLAVGSADIGIIPAAAYATIPGLVILPGVAIASRQPVRSILLVSKAPVEQVQSVAMDSSSLTSVALTKVLFAKRWGGARSYTSMEPDLEKMLQEHDAALLIGDPALQVDRSRYCTYDLAEEWIGLTGKPFVFAFWAVRRQSLKAAPAGLDLAGVFQQSRDHGLEAPNLATLAAKWAPRLGLSQESIVRYLTESIYYSLDAPCLEGLSLFYGYAAECGALPEAPPFMFPDARPLAVTR